MERTLVGVDTRGLQAGDFAFEYTFRCNACEFESGGHWEHWIACPLCLGSLDVIEQKFFLTDEGNARIYGNTEAARRRRVARGEPADLPYYFEGKTSSWQHSPQWLVEAVR